MARINPEKVYAESGNFIRRDPANTQLWQVISGGYVGEGKEKMFVMQAVLVGGIAKGKDARVAAQKLKLEAAEAAGAAG